MFTEEEIINIISTTDKSEILKKYTKNDLILMHETVYNGLSPMKSASKAAILNSIVDWHITMKRNKALFNLGN